MTIRDLPFKHNAKPALGFEMMTLSSLFARGKKNTLGHALEAPQRPEFHTVFVGIRGRGVVMCDFAPVPIGAGIITIMARGRVEAFVPTDRVDAWMLVFRPEFGELVPHATPEILWPIGEPPSLRLGDEHALVLGTIETMRVEHDGAGDPEILAALLRSILLRCERQVNAGAGGGGPLQKFFTILERDFATTRSVAHYAREAGLSPRRLGELVHAKLGRSTKQVVDERVALEHKRLLANTALTVKEIAARTGFDEATNFVKFFRHLAGTTPLEFRRNLPSGRRS